MRGSLRRATLVMLGCLAIVGCQARPRSPAKGRASAAERAATAEGAAAERATSVEVPPPAEATPAVKVSRRLRGDEAARAARARVEGSPRAGLWRSALPGSNPRLADALAATLAGSGWKVVPLDDEAICDAEAVTPERLDLLVLPGARALPADSAGPVDGFLKAGGCLVALGLPAWEDPAFRARGRWTTLADRERALAEVRPRRIVVDFAAEDPAAWSRSSNRMESPASYTFEAEGGGKVLHAKVSDMSGWDTTGRRLERPFPEGHTLTCFRARGSERTTRLAVEWEERDGSRWIATVPLGSEWRWYALAPGAFKGWTMAEGRGGAGDRLRVENAYILRVGLAFSHQAGAGGANEYWFGPLGTAPDPAGGELADFRPPHVEGLAPGYRFHDVAAPVEVAAPVGSPFGPAAAAVPGDLRALHPRPGGAGFHKDRARRWQVLLEARAPGGDYRGALAALSVELRAPYRGSMIAAFAPSDPAFYAGPEVGRLIAEVAAAMRRGVFLEEGGAEVYTAPEARPIRLGATVFARSPAPADLSVTVTVRPRACAAEAATMSTRRPEDGAPVFKKTWPVAPGADAPAAGIVVEETWTPAAWPEGGYEVLTELAAAGEVVDRLAHGLDVWRPPEKPEFVEAREGSFVLAGRPWKAHGINYMPSSGIGLDDGEVYEFWLDAAAYDPEIVQRDLERVKAMNLNAVSVFIFRRSMGAGNLLDLLRRCGALGLRVNLSLRPGTPMDFRWGEMRELIEHHRLTECDTVFAYDLAWEPTHAIADGVAEPAFRADWEAWVKAHHGSVEAAERAWGVPAPRRGGELVGAPMEQLVKDGEWRRLAADYRAFLDDLLRTKYGEARRLVRTVDPNHLVSFRMSGAGDPTVSNIGWMPYDFRGLAGAVDIWEPEAYGYVGGREVVKIGEFIAAYARLCDPKVPLIWAEVGVSTWDNDRMRNDPARLAFAAAYYRDFYRMLSDAGADGVFFWWYPGGYRVNERSDFGVVNPDGTDREVTRAIREGGRAFLAAPKPRPPEVLIEVDRDADARGLFAIYEHAKDAFWRARGEGKAAGLRWAKEPGSR